MSTLNTFFEGSYHLGDTPNAYPEADYKGKEYTWKLAIQVDSAATNVDLYFVSLYMETWAAWQSHTVFLNGNILGQLKDLSGLSNNMELHLISTPRTTFEGYVSNGVNKLKIAVGAQQPGFADDFILKLMSSSGASIGLV